MRLFKEVKNKIVVIEYLPDSEKTKEFKQNELKKIRKNEIILSAERNSNSFFLNKEINEEVGMEELLFKKGLDKYHKIECSKLSLEQKEAIIKNYLKQDDLNYIPYKIKTPYYKDDLKYLVKDTIDFSSLISDKSKEALRRLKYFLTSRDYSIIDQNRYIVRMEGIINSTEAMYLYHLLMLERYDKLIDKDIEQQIKLLNKSKKVCEFDIKELIKNDINLKTTGIISDNTETYYDKLMNKVKESEHILKLIKK